jgi:hypothetical protein
MLRRLRSSDLLPTICSLQISIWFADHLFLFLRSGPQKLESRKEKLENQIEICKES